MAANLEAAKAVRAAESAHAAAAEVHARRAAEDAAGAAALASTRARETARLRERLRRAARDGTGDAPSVQLDEGGWLIDDQEAGTDADELAAARRERAARLDGAARRFFVASGAARGAKRRAKQLEKEQAKAQQQEEVERDGGAAGEHARTQQH